MFSVCFVEKPLCLGIIAIYGLVVSFVMQSDITHGASYTLFRCDSCISGPEKEIRTFVEALRSWRRV